MRYTLTVFDKKAGITIFDNIPTSALGVTVMISRLVGVSFDEAQQITNTLNYSDRFENDTHLYRITASLDGR